MGSTNFNELRQEIIEKLNLRQYYSQELNATIDRVNSDGWTKQRFLCVFHEDKKNPAFFVNVITGGFKCQTCHAKGSIFDFWMLRNGFQQDDPDGFRKAVAALASEAGIDVAAWMKGQSQQPAGTKAKRQVVERPVVNKADENDKKYPPIPTSVMQDYVKTLVSKPLEIEYLVKERGLKQKTISQAKLGFDPRSKWKDKNEHWGAGRITIPVFNERGELRNIRKHSRQAGKIAKMINYKIAKGTEEIAYGYPPRLYNVHRLVQENWLHVVICEGEFDALLLTQELHSAGFTSWGAVSGTHGTTTFEKEWVSYFKNRHVYFCYDCDEPGIVHSDEHASDHFTQVLKQKAIKSLKVLRLPLEGDSKSKDITDYFVMGNRNIHDFLYLCEETPCRVVKGNESTEAAIDVPNYVEAVRDSMYIDSRICVPLSITGNTDRLYHAPLKVQITKCPNSGNSNCCMNIKDIHKIPHGHPIYIESCMNSVGQVNRTLAGMLCTKDQKISVKVLDKAVMEQLIVSQVVERWKTSKDEDGNPQNAQELVTTPVYLLRKCIDSYGPQNYRASGYIRTNPKTSGACMFIDDLTALDDDWKSFDDSSPYNQNLLNQVKSMSVNDILSDITNGVTKIYKTDDLLLAVLLTYLAPLHFNFNKDLIRGWINTCIIGDSGTGKSDTYMRISDWIEVGDLFSALSGTRTGLLYNLQQKNNEWSVRIGRYVQCHQKILAIDETQEMEKDQVKPMAIAMDTGWLQVERVASGGYSTQTRALFLMNPKKHERAATIGDFTYGCEALRHSFDPMFIRRIDLAVFTSRMHRCSFYNRKQTQEESRKEMKLSASMLRALIFWAWTRKPKDIIWNEDATDLCLEKASEISDKFGRTDSIPLTAPQDMRKKLARLATAYAVLDGSISDDYKQLIVKTKHVKKITAFLDAIYSFDTCSLDKYSEASRLLSELDGEEETLMLQNQMLAKAQEYCIHSGNLGTSMFLKLLIEIRNCELFTQRQLQDVLGMDRSKIRVLLSYLRSRGFIEPARGRNKITRRFNLFMRAWEENPEIRQALEDARLNYSNYLKDSSQHSEPDSDFNSAFEEAATDEGQFISDDDEFFTR